MKKYIVLIALLPILMFAQSEKESPSMGLTAAVQQSTFDIQVPIWVSSGTIIAPTFGTRYKQDIGSELDFGLGARFFMNAAAARPFIGARAGIFHTSYTSTDHSTMDYIFGTGYGVEYFFNPNFSLGIEGQLNFVFLDLDSPSFIERETFNINTAAVLFASIYF